MAIFSLISTASLLSLLFCLANGDFIQLEPQSVHHHNMPNVVNVSCQARSTIDAGARVTRIELAMSPDVPLASINASQRVTISKGVGQLFWKFEAEGVISPNNVGSRLSMKLYDVRIKATFMCTFIYVRQSGKPYIGRNSKNIRFYNDNDAVTTQDKIMALSLVKRHIADLRAFLYSTKQKNKAQLAEQRATLAEKEMANSLDVFALERQVERQEKDLRRLKEKDDEVQRTWFIVAQNSRDVVKADQKTRIAYSAGSGSHGKSFDPPTGTFTAPMAGFYLFHFSFFVPKGTDLYVHMRKGNQTESTLIVGAKDKWQKYADGSHVLYLHIGESVHLVAGPARSSQYGHIADLPNRFQGCLLKATTQDGTVDNVIHA